MKENEFIFMSNKMDLNSFEPKEEGAIHSPFCMEEILRACPVLLSHWRKNPFTFEFDDHNRVITRYIEVK